MFYNESKPKKNFFWAGAEGVGVRGARVSEFLLLRILI